MIKTVGIVSLSSGKLGEAFAEHEVKIGVKRLSEYGLTVRFMPHAKKGIEYVREHPRSGRRICWKHSGILRLI